MPTPLVSVSAIYANTYIFSNESTLIYGLYGLFLHLIRVSF